MHARWGGLAVLACLLLYLLPCCAVACADAQSAMRYWMTPMTELVTSGPRIAAILKIRDRAVVRIVSNDNKVITDTRAETDPGGWVSLRDGHAAVQVRN